MSEQRNISPKQRDAIVASYIAANLKSSVPEISIVLNLDAGQVQNSINRLKEAKLIYVASYRRVNGNTIAEYAEGNLPDVEQVRWSPKQPNSDAPSVLGDDQDKPFPVVDPLVWMTTGRPAPRQTK